MKIAVIAEYAFTKYHGGLHNSAIEVAKGLKRKGFDVCLYTLSKDLPKDVGIDIKTIPIKRHFILSEKLHILNTKNYSKALNKLLHKNEPDLIHFHSPSFISLNVDLNVPKIMTCHGVVSHEFEQAAKELPFIQKIISKFIIIYERGLEKKMYNKMDKIIAVSKNIEREINSIVDKEVQIVTNGVDLRVFKPNKKIKKVNQVIFVGKISTIKGIPYLIRAAKNIAAKVVCVGQIRRRDYYEDGLKNGVKFLGSLSKEELVKEYNKSKIFILPSTYEAQPLTVLEAMACGLPVVVTERAGAGIVENKRNGFVIKSGSPKEIANSVNFLLKNSGEVNKIRENNLNDIKRYKWEKIVERYSKIKWIRFT